MIDQIPLPIAIPLILALWTLLIVLHVRDRRRDPRPYRAHMTLDCLGHIHGACTVCDCRCHEARSAS